MPTTEVNVNAAYRSDKKGSVYITDNLCVIKIQDEWVPGVSYREFDLEKRWFVNQHKHYSRPLNEFKAKFTEIMRDVI